MKNQKQTKQRRRQVWPDSYEIPHLDKMGNKIKTGTRRIIRTGTDAKMLLTDLLPGDAASHNIMVEAHNDLRIYIPLQNLWPEIGTKNEKLEFYSYRFIPSARRLIEQEDCSPHQKRLLEIRIEEYKNGENASYKRYMNQLVSQLSMQPVENHPVIAQIFDCY